jgi:septum formation inhibitor-activating ATPase MinD
MMHYLKSKFEGWDVRCTTSGANAAHLAQIINKSALATTDFGIVNLDAFINLIMGARKDVRYII